MLINQLYFQIYIDDIFNIDTYYVNQILGQIYPIELELDKANPFATKATVF